MSSAEPSDQNPSDHTSSDQDEREVASLSYEEAKEELVSIVATLESGSASLEESMRLWERGETLARHCTQWLDEAQAAVEGGGSEGESRAGAGA